MARSKKQVTQDKARPTDGKAVFQVRLDADVHEKLKTAAATAGISMNQLIQGVLRWAGDHVRQGRPTLSGKTIGEEPCAECVWFGVPTKPVGIGDRGHEGDFVFLLDYSDRKALSTSLSEGAMVDGRFVEGGHSIDDGDFSQDFEARLHDAKAKRNSSGSANNSAM